MIRRITIAIGLTLARWLQFTARILIFKTRARSQEGTYHGKVQSRKKHTHTHK